MSLTMSLYAIIRVSLFCAQFLLRRDDLHHIKSGEEEKRKIYRALVTLGNKTATEDIITRLNINEPFDIQQWTPLRVLHRRTLIKRPRTIHSVKAFAVKGKFIPACTLALGSSPFRFSFFLAFTDKPHLLVLDIITQAGTYVKELVHGEFGRTEPSISSFISTDVDIIALDVMNIELNFPPTMEREVVT
jgi:tRNA pseudouridine synthase 10